MPFQQFQHLYYWCLTIYIATFGREEGLTRFNRLTLIDAVDLWKAGGGEPLTGVAQQESTRLTLIENAGGSDR